MSNALTRMRSGLRAQGFPDQRIKPLVFWARTFLSFSGRDDPADVGRADLERFLRHLGEERGAEPASTDTALEAIEHLFDNCDSGMPSWLKAYLGEQRSAGRSNVLTTDEVRRLLARLTGASWIAGALIYGTGIRLLECVRLRVRDIDFDHDCLMVRGSDESIHRRPSLPPNIHERLQEHLEELKLNHIRDIVEGTAAATLPPPVAARHPERARAWGWQYLFPDRSESTAGPPADGRAATHHIDPRTLHRVFARAALEAGIYRRVTGHALRNSYAMRMIQQGVPASRVERMLGTTDDASGDGEWRSLSIPVDVEPRTAEVH